MRKIQSFVLLFLGVVGVAAALCCCNFPKNIKNVNNMKSSPTIIRLGEPQGFDLDQPGTSIDNHPTGVTFYQREWGNNDLGVVEFWNGNHSFVIDNVLSIMGVDDKDVPGGINKWAISFGVSPEQADTHEAALSRITKLLAQLRAAGWKRYIQASDPRLSGQTAWKYLLSDPMYSLDSSYTPTLDQWLLARGNSPSWIFDADGVYVEVSVNESNMGGFVGKSTYLLSVDVRSEYGFYGLGYFPGNTEKLHNWKSLLPAELGKYHAMRLKTEATLKAQGYTIDTTYQDPPIKALQVTSDKTK